MPPPLPLWRVGWFGRERHVPGERWWWDNRGRDGNLAVFQYAVSGEMLFRDASGDHRVGPGHAALFCHPSESSYGLLPDAREPFVTEWIVMSGAGLHEHWQALIALRGPVVAIDPDGPIPRAFFALMAAAEPRARAAPEVMAAMVHAFVLNLWSGAAAARAGNLRPVDQAVEAMLAAPIAPWSVKRLATQYGVSREHLARAFRERVGLPPAAWQARERVRVAVELLERTDLPVRAVRDQAGFASSHALIRRVRSATGFAPVELRQRSRK
jgi:AraC-like DNA-binding protein